MIRADRELLCELAAANTDVVPVAMAIMEGSATTAEQRALGLRLMAIGDRLVRRAESAAVFVVDGAVDSRPT